MFGKGARGLEKGSGDNINPTKLEESDSASEKCRMPVKSKFHMNNKQFFMNMPLQQRTMSLRIKCQDESSNLFRTIMGN